MLLSGNRAISTATVVAFAAGLAVVLWSIWESRAAHAAGGAVIAMTAALVHALNLIKRWVTDTTAERNAALSTIRAAEDERTRQVALQAATTVERDRLRRETTACLQRAATQVEAERRKLQAKFDADHDRMLAESLETAFLMIKNGILAEPDRRRTVVPFPTQHPVDSDRARGRDVSRP
ncbi:hypothetical protein [Actinacidiphila glaucinigra]|uniref:hypothetical protein n=1 Tax=Actinacidiphila glaucinigra TaxID=235986 RepID=UPI0035DA1866